MSGITIIIPTIGRSTLHRTIRSLQPDLTNADQIIVIPDGPEVDTRDVEIFVGIWPTSKKHGYWGHPLRNIVLDSIPDGDYVWTIDDDDVAAPGALDALRSRMDGHWTIFRMEFGPGSHAHGITCWRAPHLHMGDIGTPMVFAPKGKARFGHRYEGDWDYVQALQAQMGEPTWDERVIAIIRPDDE